MASVAAASTPFERTLETLTLPKHDVNILVMDFLVQQGYPDAAARFAEEADIDTGAENSLMEERVNIRNAIFRGDLESAIEEINEIDTQLLDNNPALLFSLLRLQLIELIKRFGPAPEAERPGLLKQCLDFARQNLSPYTPRDEKFKRDIERAMSLLIVKPDVWRAHLSGAPMTVELSGALPEAWDLVSPNIKMEIANNVNTAILRSVGQRERSRIHTILQTRTWAEDLARAKGLDLPQDLSVSLHDSPVAIQPRNGNGDTQMTEDADESRNVEERYTNIHESPH